MELNAPLVVGGLVAWFVPGTVLKGRRLNKARFDRGTLIAWLHAAGGALMGVVSAILKFVGVDWFLFRLGFRRTLPSGTGLADVPV